MSLVAACWLFFWAPALLPALTWTSGTQVPGIYDVAGPRQDGKLVIGAPAGKLFLLDTAAGTLQPFANGWYRGPDGGEAYFALSPGFAVGSCRFARDDLFALGLTPAGAVLRIDASGAAQPFAVVDGVESLNGIAFDGNGAFGHRLLGAGPLDGNTTVAAIDCSGKVDVITRSAPVLEGGLAVAPASFGDFAADLIAPDELSGVLYAIAPDGSSRTVAHPDLATGGDIGVEGVGFVPQGPVAGMTAYFADRATGGNPHPGTDHLLTISGHELANAGVRPGDLLVATEGGAGLVSVRCAGTCSVQPVIADNPVSHGEGHVIVAGGRAGPSVSPSPALVRTSSSLLVDGGIAVAAFVVVVVAMLLVLRRRGR